MTDCAEGLLLTGVVLPCPDCAGERIFVAPDEANESAYGADFACTDCGAALLVDPCLLFDATAAPGSGEPRLAATG